MSSVPPLVLLAHGAGAGSSSAWMRAWATRLGAIGRVVPFDYPYMTAGKKMPDRLPALIAAHRAALGRARTSADQPVILAGKSMGARVSCHVGNEEGVRGVICFGYPLVGVGKPQAIRTDVLLELSNPVLFVQGTRDEMCPLDKLAEVRARMTARSSLHLVDGGDHSLVLSAAARAARGITQEGSDVEVLGAVTGFVRSLG